ncbi:histidine kinase CheY-like domain protein [Candidatus Vecturithrix granuli]|uniref:Histidine kinase CheY-like domain protein n=1 Tax=Vecturithrix granuli TaxID=1499967 RepID=A0A081C9V3_VECG1|nr:histidine kinase CheY-like domain protein [Candidatus Vecturithrix granuli]
MNTTALRRVILSVACLLLLIGQGMVYAENPIRFDHVFDLGVPGGQTFVQDNDGFLWIGSDGGGMFRYDGYELKNYGVGPRLLSNGNVWRILEDRENRDIFWIGTSGGLNRFDKATNTFTVYQHDPGNPQSIGNNTIQNLVQDSADANVL